VPPRHEHHTPGVGRITYEVAEFFVYCPECLVPTSELD